MDHHDSYQNSNLPMPIEGGDLEVATHHHHHHTTTPKPYDSIAASGGQGHYYQPYQTQIPLSSPTLNPGTLKEEDRILGLKPRTLLLITTGLLILLMSAIALVGGLLGSKIAKLESSSSSDVSSPQASESSSDSPTKTSSAPATFTTNVQVPGFKYIGCYIDDNTRILPEFTPPSSTSMTNQLCANSCTSSKSYKYFGTESRDQCYCSNFLASDAASRKANEWNCNQNCAGSDGRKQEICGGNFFISVWERV
ncbi:hypothetical protein QBC43DRAFT_311859 [Cladorrhinum sp. PSN259]|nr:hypothetical protein QBC43DRAFT_311859 [Cladorrhinum sp. PSN259]